MHSKGWRRWLSNVTQVQLQWQELHLTHSPSYKFSQEKRPIWVPIEVSSNRMNLLFTAFNFSDVSGELWGPGCVPRFPLKQKCSSSRYHYCLLLEGCSWSLRISIFRRKLTLPLLCVPPGSAHIQRLAIFRVKFWLLASVWDNSEGPSYFQSSSWN